VRVIVVKEGRGGGSGGLYVGNLPDHSKHGCHYMALQEERNKEIKKVCIASLFSVN